jgi:feruloyl esterase
MKSLIRTANISNTIVLGLLSILVGPAALAASSHSPSSDCMAPIVQGLAPAGMLIGPITDANLELGPHPTGALFVPAASGLPAYCQITGTVITNRKTGKTANFGVLLPEHWNYKLLFEGCGGLCGVVFGGGVSGDGLVKGYAEAATDDGHQAFNSVFEAQWALTSSGDPDYDAIADVSYRAVHKVAIKSKQLAENWYHHELSFSYFEGRSGGGREGMAEAIRYPADFDGIIAGDPTFDYRARTMHFFGALKGLLKSKNAYIDPTLLASIDKRVQQECDALDGVVDGLIQNPAKCGFKAESLLCTKRSNANCLNKDQVNLLENYLGAAVDPGGNVAAFGAPVSDLADSSLQGDFEGSGPPSDIDAAEPWGNSPPTSWFAVDNILRYFVYRDSYFNSNANFAMSFSNIVADSAIRKVDKRTEGLDGNEPERISALLRTGHKVILYHGLSDGRVPPFDTIRFYEDSARLNGGLQELQEGVRLFLEPGMHHCGGGPGPNSFDLLTPLEQWVERGLAPEAIPATKFVNDDPAMGIARTMPLCKFPEMARYSGSGDVNDGAQWVCPSHNSSLLESGLDGDRAGVRGVLVPEHRRGEDENVEQQ